MTYFLEMGPERQGIEWQRHLLSDAMADYVPALVLEPSRRAESDLSNRRLVCSADIKGISWRWGAVGGAWQEVRAQLFDDNSKPFSMITKHPPEPSRFTWEELSFCGAVELTPQDAAGREGVIERLVRPLRLTPADVRCQDRERGHVSLVTTYKRPQDLRVRLLKLKGTAYKVLPEFYDCDSRGSCQFELPANFTGVIALVYRRGSDERLMYYEGWHGRGNDPFRRFQDSGEPIDAAEWEEIRRYVEVDGRRELTAYEQLRLWLKEWPSRSSRLLEGIYDEAANSIIYGVEAAHAMRETPTGLFRALVLYRCNYQFTGQFNELIKQLDIGRIDEALQRIAPGLPALLTSVNTVAEKRWIIRHAHHPKAAEAVEWAGGGGAAALDHALGLIGLRDSVKERKEKLRHDTVQWREAEEILDKIQQAPFDESPVSELKQKFERIARSIEAEERGAVNPDTDAPITIKEFREWVEKRKRMEEWRGQLLCVLTYCDTGQWCATRAPTDKLPAAEELLEWTKRLKPPRKVSLREPLLMVKDYGAELSELARTLIERQENEPTENLRVLVRERLQTVVIKHASDWAPMHEQIKRAEALAAQYTWFAEAAGVLSHEGERIDAAQKFLSMVEALEQSVAASPRSFLAGSEVELKAVLADPRHPAIDAALERADELHRLLSPTEHVKKLPLPSRPTPPEQLSLVALKRWWAQLDELNEVLRRLEAGRERFKADVEQFQKDRRSDVAERRMYWAARPAAERPEYYTSFVTLSERCAGTVESVRPDDLLRLLQLIEQDKRVRNKPARAHSSTSTDSHERI